MLAQSKIFPGTDGKHYMCIRLTDQVPTESNKHQLYDLITYVPTLGKVFTIIIDTREAPSTFYLKYFSEFLDVLSNAPGDCVERCEVWVKPTLGKVLGWVQGLIRDKITTHGSKIELRTYG